MQGKKIGKFWAEKFSLKISTNFSALKMELTELTN
jgi:hypothetical protein